MSFQQLSKGNTSVYGTNEKFDSIPDSSITGLMCIRRLRTRGKNSHI